MEDTLTRIVQYFNLSSFSSQFRQKLCLLVATMPTSCCYPQGQVLSRSMQILRGLWIGRVGGKSKPATLVLVGLDGVVSGERAGLSTKGNACVTVHQQPSLLLSFSCHNTSERFRSIWLQVSVGEVL